jgi:hypothetical protein
MTAALRTLLAATAYLVLTLAMTWPLAAHPGRDLPSDLGDPLLNTWIIGRNDLRFEAALAHGPSTLSGFWDARVFHPEPLTLAYSEHLIAQSVQALPVHAFTGNPILAYNVVFLSTFVLSGLFCFLLVRDLTGSDAAAFVAGLFFAFAPYRFYQLSHVQMLSTQWMPLVLLGLYRYFETRSLRALAVAVAALVVHGLSCSYLLFYFAPFVALFALYEMIRRGRLRDGRTWLHLTVAGGSALALSLPFLLPYRELQARGGLGRELWEVQWGAADVTSYLVAPEILKVLGPVLRAHEKPEGALYPGLTVVALALVAMAVGVRHRSRQPWVFFAIATVLAFWLSLGPTVMHAGQETGIPSLYRWLMHVPGYGSLRVPARFAMLVAFFLAVLAGYGAAALLRARRGLAVLTALCALFLVETDAAPITINVTSPLPDLKRPAAPIRQEAESPAVYDAVRNLPAESVVIELPFGVPGYDLQAMFYTLHHGHRLVNGYSGWQPPTNVALCSVLTPHPWRAEQASWEAMMRSGATHAIVHTGAWRHDQGEKATAWLERNGARRLFADGDDLLFALPTPSRAGDRAVDPDPIPLR